MPWGWARGSCDDIQIHTDMDQGSWNAESDCAGFQHLQGPLDVGSGLEIRTCDHYGLNP